MPWGEGDGVSATIVVWVLDPEIALILKATVATTEEETRCQKAFGPLLSETLDFKEGKVFAQGHMVSL